MAEVPDSYRGRLAQYRILEESRHALIEELLDKLEKTEAKLQQTELDLQSEQNVRRRLQSEVVESTEREAALVERTSRRPYAMVLIEADPDGFMFLDKYTTKGTKGGEALADELSARLQEYFRPLYDDADKLDLLVRVYANLEGMANAMVREGKVRNLGQLRAFATGFCARVPGFDWIDVGVGKEGGAGRKIRENLTLSTSHLQCRHLILATTPGSVPATFFASLSSTPLTLLDHPSFKPLALPNPTTILPSIFLAPPPPRPSRNGRPQLQLASKEEGRDGSTWLVIRPERSKSQGARSRSRRGGGSDDEDSALSISIGPDNTVSVGRDGPNGRKRILN
ncbi:uncharacterized protein BDZ99DRAFT_463249 [Mytilinidion resinicola]|uniref:DUF7923 domain-containing protein n=1 Tax=Mytilinidion resinicola TaxID=574789 RepID=A0A6A6YKQ3_9PEZI|nr:uncharacterized protein BDZ99DRAFT_463249 [Mytilinidion resinicola]KAF2809452.1 hypothetical protein BDZ99DRAFT_463249 [Mytilinidion resinicola]